jgi:hypothetical protein
MLRAYIVTLKYGVTESGKEIVWEGRDNEEELHILRFLLLLSDRATAGCISAIAVVRQSNSWLYIGYCCCQTEQQLVVYRLLLLSDRATAGCISAIAVVRQSNSWLYIGYRCCQTEQQLVVYRLLLLSEQQLVVYRLLLLSDRATAGCISAIAVARQSNSWLYIGSTS